MADDMTEGVVYPLTSKRNYWKHLARELSLPIVAPRGDLEVMMHGKLIDMNFDVENLQVVITPSQEGETLSFKSVDGSIGCSNSQLHIQRKSTMRAIPYP